MGRFIAAVAVVLSYVFASVPLHAEDVFARPLIAGASVSAGHGTISPGHRVALRHTAEDSILTVAEGGRTSLEIVPRLSEATIASRTIVIGVDLFFWDSTLDDAEQTLRNLAWIIQTSAAANTALVIGNIPSLLPGLQPQQTILNEKIGELCQPSARCYVLDLFSFHKKIEEDGYIEINGRRYTMADIVPDGLHLSDVASEYISGLIETLVPASDESG